VNEESIAFTKLANFQPKQLEDWYTLFDPLTKYLLVGGAAGGGKSYFLRWGALGLSMYYFKKYGLEKVPIGLFSEDYPTLRDRQVTKIAREFPPEFGVLKETQKDGLAFYLAREYGGGMLLLRNLDDPSKYASVEFAAEFVEELTKNKYETFEDLRTRMRFPGIEERKFVAGTNPGEIGHGWVKRLWISPDPKEPDVEQNRFRFIQSLYSDNKYNPSDYVLQLQAIRDPHKRKALLEGSWESFEGQYFEEWTPSLHKIPSFIPFKSSLIVGGLDWGRTKPFSFHLTSIEKMEYKEITFYRAKTFFEVYGVDKNPREWSDTIKNRLEDFNLTLSDIAWVRADPKIFSKGDDKGKSIADQFIDSDEGWRKIKMANNDRISGWSVMHNWLSIAPDGLPYWQISEHCKNLIRTLPDQVHDKNIVEDVDTEGEDHAVDDQRYQFKHLKWIDAKAGGVVHTGGEKKQLRVAEFIEGKQVSINLDSFINPNQPVNEKGIGAIVH
jgi:phage terminase large subunit